MTSNTKPPYLPALITLDHVDAVRSLSPAGNLRDAVAGLACQPVDKPVQRGRLHPLPNHKRSSTQVDAQVSNTVDEIASRAVDNSADYAAGLWSRWRSTRAATTCGSCAPMS